MFSNAFKFGTKAETLERLRPLIVNCTIPLSFSFSIADWLFERIDILTKIQQTFDDKTLIVRSSSAMEDGGETAMAGAFLSIANVPGNKPKDIEAAVGSVIASYGQISDTGEASRNNQVLIQEMISDVAMSGVVFTHDMNTGAPYYVVNYDDESGTTDSITSGNYNNRTLFVLRRAVKDIESSRFRVLFAAIEEIEAVLSDNFVDIEFAVDHDNKVILFQVRRITTHSNWNRSLSLQVYDATQRAEDYVAARYCYKLGAEGVGLDAVLGNMPDWNPAEMIGTAPRQLAYSLYRHLITDRTWRVARRKMGYHERLGRPLMIALSGQPFIDVKESFYSYLPEELEGNIGDKLVAGWLSRLRQHRHLHDKVEFEVATTCYSFDFRDLVASMFPDVLSPQELDIYETHLRNQTNRHVGGDLASIDSQFEAIEGLASRFKALMGQSHEASLELLSSLLEDAIEHGTLPFSILARHGFIATSLFKSLVAVGIFSKDDIADFQRSVPTVASEFVNDMSALSNGNLPAETFLKTYGHLRPGTYDILSLRYDQRDLGESAVNRSALAHRVPAAFTLSSQKRAQIAALIRDHGLTFSVTQLFDYMTRAIQGREYAKFVFTKNLSMALELIATWGRKLGLSREELSHLDIRDILDCLTTPTGRSLESSLREKSVKGHNTYQIATAVRLPFLITKMSDLRIVPLAVDSPNFVTRKNVSGSVINVTGTSADPQIIDDKIVAIESADPGFDWIFSRPIRGLVTKFGGMNSHMAIRCAEFNLPAAIGCGEQIFSRASENASIELLCGEGQIKFIKDI